MGHAFNWSCLQQQTCKLFQFFSNINNKDYWFVHMNTKYLQFDVKKTFGIFSLTKIKITKKSHSLWSVYFISYSSFIYLFIKCFYYSLDVYQYLCGQEKAFHKTNIRLNLSKMHSDNNTRQSCHSIGISIKA